jgi:hypothetical protein
MGFPAGAPWRGETSYKSKAHSPPGAFRYWGTARAKTAPSIGHMTSFGVWQYGQVRPSGTSRMLPLPTASNGLPQWEYLTFLSMPYLLSKSYAIPPPPEDSFCLRFGAHSFGRSGTGRAIIRPGINR